MIYENYKPVDFEEWMKQGVLPSDSVGSVYLPLLERLVFHIKRECSDFHGLKKFLEENPEENSSAEKVLYWVEFAMDWKHWDEGPLEGFRQDPKYAYCMQRSHWA